MRRRPLIRVFDLLPRPVSIKGIMDLERELAPRIGAASARMLRSTNPNRR
jgi:hypothetical protein